MSVTGTIRFLIGAALVAAGVPLVSPLARNMVAAACASSTARDGGGGAGVLPPAPAGGAPVPAGVPAPASSAAAVAEEAGVALATCPWNAVDAGMDADSSGGLQLDRSPPPPPAPLPPLPEEMQQSSPPFAAAYRSTLRVPPPDLLDAAGPPPAVQGTAPPRASPAAAWRERGGARGTQDVPVAEITVPSTYRVRDGDDLGSIAGRFYGHPAAAMTIWAANRQVIPHPDLLPIGVDLRLPPPWSVTTSGHGSRGAIEPAAYSRPAVAPEAHAGAPVSVRGDAWLAPAGEPQPTSGLAPAARVPAAAFPAASVRVGPGETLASLARRLYGDPAMAESIFAANRDRLRSPELVVAGMELRLPRPVTAPRP